MDDEYEEEGTLPLRTLDVPADRNYGRIEMLVLQVEDAMRAAPDSMGACRLNDLIEEVTLVVGGPEAAGKSREKARFVSRRAVKSVLAKPRPDLVLAPDDRLSHRKGNWVMRSETYLQPDEEKLALSRAKARVKEQRKREARRLPELNHLPQVKGFWAQRFAMLEEIVDREQARLDAGAAMVELDPWDAHMLCAVVSPDLVSDVVKKARKRRDDGDAIAEFV